MNASRRLAKPTLILPLGSSVSVLIKARKGSSVETTTTLPTLPLIGRALS